MKKWIIIVSVLLAAVTCANILLALAQQEDPAQTLPETTAAPAPPETLPPAPAVPETTPETAPETTAETTVPVEPAHETEPEYVLTFTEEEEQLLLKLGMAERGDTCCTECIALVMRTVLNRVEGPKFSSTIKGVIYAQDQFTPVMDGSFASAQPNAACYEALEMVKRGWDESQGALYYEWCEGESWHSRNLNLLLQHCDTRFYN